jgi:hypothetical protein
VKKAWLVAVVSCGVLLGARSPAGASSLAWEFAASIPSARSIAVSGVLGGKGYVASGRVATADCGYSTTLQVYDPSADSWSFGAPMATNREGACGDVIGDHLYVVGGANGCGSYLASVEAYDSVSGTWGPRAALASPRYAATASAWGGKLYVFGGYYAPLGYLQSAEVYDPAADSWSPIAAPPRAITTGSSVALGDRIYLMAGSDGVGAPVDVHVYDPTTDTWSAGPDLPYGAVATGATAHDGTVWIAGGAFDFTVYANVWRLDLATDTWVEEAPMNVARFGLSLFSLGGSLVAASGQNISSMTAAVEHYEPIPSTNTPPVADAGDDATVSCAPASGASVTLDGTGSTDADADALTHAWSAAGISFDDPTSATPTATFPVGTTTVTLTVSDGTATDADTVTVVVEADEPPTIAAPADVTVEATGPAGQAVALGAATAGDACGTPTVANDAPALFPLGTTLVTWTATDGNGGTATDVQSVTVVDTTAPTISVSGLPATIKKDKDLVTVTAAVAATDAADPAPTISVSVSCSVPLAPGDVVVHSPTNVEVNAEKGRVYTFTWTAQDASGNASSTSGVVTVTASGK